MSSQCRNVLTMMAWNKNWSSQRKPPHPPLIYCDTIIHPISQIQFLVTVPYSLTQRIHGSFLKQGCSCSNVRHRVAMVVWGYHYCTAWSNKDNSTPLFSLSLSFPLPYSCPINIHQITFIDWEKEHQSVMCCLFKITLNASVEDFFFLLNWPCLKTDEIASI